MQSEVYLGLGSNLGNRAANIARAVDALRDTANDVVVSSLYETAPIGFSAQPPFLNAACGIWTRQTPFELLAILNRIQQTIGGHSAFINGPRAIDLDILVCGRMVIETPALTIPHPRMADREFVLTPLAEIAPGLVHPVLKQTVPTLLDGIAGRVASGILLARLLEPKLKTL